MELKSDSLCKIKTLTTCGQNEEARLLFGALDVAAGQGLIT